MPDGNSAESGGESFHEPAPSAHTPETDAPIAQEPTGKQPQSRPWWMWVAGGVLIVLALIEGVPRIITAFRTVSTDDAYLNGHVTFVAPRVPGQIVRVLVDDNNRVRKGNLLVQLDKEPYQVKVAIAQAALAVGQANLVTAQANVRGLEAQARSQRFDLANAIDNVNGQIADLHAKVATLQAANASLVKARADYGREQQLLKHQVISQSEFDAYQEAFSVQAEAKLSEAEANLRQAQLDLSYCDVVAEIDGVVTRRSVNPGNHVVAGEEMMAVRSLTEIWVDANFKETQLEKLRIGQPVDLDVDMYGSRQHFRGRISGFTMGTGSTLALLPAENATGNFVKVVQRLPVRIDLIDYNPEVTPLFIGLSVTPYVYVGEKPGGPDAGKMLQSLIPATVPVSAPGPQ